MSRSLCGREVERALRVLDRTQTSLRNWGEVWLETSGRWGTVSGKEALKAMIRSLASASGYGAVAGGRKQERGTGGFESVLLILLAAT